MSKEKKKGSKLFLGIFLGFLLCLGTIAGLGTLVYFKGNIGWVNRFGANIDTGSDKLNSMTVREIINSSSKVLNNQETISLNDVALEFGYTPKTELYGVDVSDVFNSPIKNLSNAVKTKFKNVSASEIEGLVNLSSINGVLSSKRTYYVVGTNLYEDQAKTKLADFAYSVNTAQNKVQIKSQQLEIKTQDGNKYIEVEARYLPLTYALADVQENTIAEVLNFTHQGGEYYKNGVVSEAYKIKGIMKVLAPKKIKDLNTAMDEITISDMFETSALENSVFELIPNYQSKTIAQIPDALKSAVQDATINSLYNKGLLKNISASDYAKVSGTIGNKTISDIVNDYVQAAIAAGS